jgi:hypothetical protein
MTKWLLLFLILGVACVPVFGQDQPAQQQPPSAEDQEKEKAEREKNAYRLLDQVIDEAQSLRLTENRVRVQITAADLLWDNNQGRARSLFAMAAEGVAELNRNAQQNNNNRRGGGAPNRSFQLRQELVLTAARHDAQLAYQLLAATKAPAPAIDTNQNARNRIQITSDENLEQTLLGRIASLDPKLAATNAEQMMDKGTFPRTLPDVLTQLRKQDADAATKLADRTVKKLEAANLLDDNDAANLAQMLIAPGPRAADANSKTTAPATTTGRAPALDQGSYVELLGNVVDLALKAKAPTPPTGVVAVPANLRRDIRTIVDSSTQSQPTDAQLEQSNARRLLAGLQPALPLIDQYLPSKATLVRQKLAELGMNGSSSQVNLLQTFGALQGNPNADALLQAAASAPPQMQSRLYQQAAYQALDEGDTTRARQIAADHLQANARDTVMQRIDFRELAQKADGVRLDQIRQVIARAQSDDEKLNLLLQIAGDMQKTNPKLANQLLDEAKQMTSRRATSYDQFDQQLRVAHAFVDVDPARSFEVLDPGIGQLNELLSAAAVLNGFEVNLFRDGEMSMQAGSGLTGMLNRFSQELAQLARADLERSETLAGHFQFPEPRIMARLAIVQGLLGVKPTTNTQRPMNFFSN